MPKYDPDFVPARGDIVWLIFDPRVGHEQSGRRPALVLSGALFNERTSLCVVCPITTQANGLPFEIKLVSGSISGACLPIHVKSVDYVARKAIKAGSCPRAILDKVTEAVADIIET